MLNNPIEFSKEQRQSSIGMMIEFLLLLKKFWKSFAALLVYLLVKLEWQQYGYILLFLLLVIIFLSVLAYLNYKHTLFYIHYQEKEFVLRKGIFNKSQHILHLDKITQVNINQHFIQRWLQVFEVEIETAGSSKTEVILKALDENIAFALKNELLKIHTANVNNNEAELIAQQEANQNEEKTIKIKPQQLIAYAFTADYFRGFLVLIGVLFSFYSRIQEYLGSYFQEIERWEAEAIARVNFSIFIIITFSLWIFSIIANAIKNIIRYYGLQIKLEAKSTWIAYGLLNRKNTMLQNEKTQIFKINTNWIQRKLNLYSLHIQQLAQDIQQDKKAKINILACNENQYQQLFQQIYQEQIPSFDYHLKSNFRLLIPHLFLWGILPILLVLMLIYWQVIPIATLFIFIIYLPMLFIFLRRYLKTYQLGISSDFLQLESKVWNEKRTIIAIKDIQSLQMTQYAWHRTSGLVQFTIQTAGGSINFHNGNIEVVQELINLLLYKIEKD